MPRTRAASPREHPIGGTGVGRALAAVALVAVFAAVATVVTGCVGPSSRGTGMPAGDDDPTRLGDREAIARLHELDRAASRAKDFDTLRSIIDRDAVILPPGAEPLVGASAIDANFRSMERVMASVEVLEYTLDIEQVEIVEDFAFEWGVIRGATRDLASGEVTRTAFRVMRVLRRRPDGEWRVYRSIWNEAPE